MPTLRDLLKISFKDHIKGHNNYNISFFIFHFYISFFYVNIYTPAFTFYKIQL